MTITFHSIPWGLIGMLLVAGIGLAHFLTKWFEDEDEDKGK